MSLVVAGLLAGAVLDACSGAGQHAPRPQAGDGGSPAPSSPRPALLVLPKPSHYYAMAGFKGRIGVDARGCFALDGTTIVAPFGSQVLNENAFAVPGYGTVRIGQIIETSGGVTQGADRDLEGGTEPVDDLARCVPAHGSFELDVLNFLK